MSTERSILIVEDEMIVQLHLRRIVEGLGHRVVGTATTMQEALDVADDDPPELVMMDIHLAEGTDGVETARLLNQRHDCAVVFATAYADESTLERTAAVVPAGYIVKPYSEADVRVAIATALNAHAHFVSTRGRERSLASVLREMGEAVFITDEQGIITFANPATAGLTGWAPEEACDRDLFDVLAFEGTNDTRVRDSLGRCLETGAPDVFPMIELLRENSTQACRLEIAALRERDSDPAGLVVTLQPSGSYDSQELAAVSEETIPFGPGVRMVVYSHDTFGLGHLRRCLKLTRALVDRYPGISILLITGSPMAHSYEMPPGVDYVKLPAIRKVGKENYEPRSLAMSGRGIRTLRSNLLLRTISDFDPNVLLVDHAPTGSKGELRAALDWLGDRGGCTRMVGLRDVIDAPEEIVPLWSERGIYDVLRDSYDHVFVYGSQKIFDTVEQYRIPAEVGEKTRFVGYVCERAPDASDDNAADSDPVPGAKSATGSKDATDTDVPDGPDILVTIGGGDGAAKEVIGTFLEMMETFRDRANYRATVLTGPFIEDDLAREYHEKAARLGVAMESFLPSTEELIRSSRLVISTAGYNTTTDVLSYAHRCIIVPRVLHRQEQLVRGRCLEELGIGECIDPAAITPEILLEAIERALSDEEGALDRMRAAGEIPLDGAARFAEECGTLRVPARE